MKKILSLFTVCILCSLSQIYAQNGHWIDFADTDWFSQKKTSYTISTAEELAGLSKLVNEGHSFKDTTFVLSDKAVIDLREHYWCPIAYLENTSFKGILEGNNRTIRNIYVGKNAEYHNSGVIEYKTAGFFGYIGEGAEIKNLSIEGGEIVGLKNLTTANYPINTGGLIGAAVNSSINDSIIIRNCHNIGVSIVGGVDYSSNHDGSHTGGLIGFASGKVLIDNCSNNAPITINGVKDMAAIRVGGVIGSAKGHFIISHSGNTGDIFSSFCWTGSIGGVIGSGQTDNINSCKIKSCYNKASITNKDGMSSGWCGGLMGTLNYEAFSTEKGGSFILENSFSDTSFDLKGVATSFFVGNITRSFLDNVIVRNCYATGNANNEAYASNLFKSYDVPGMPHTAFQITGNLYVADNLKDNALPPDNSLVSLPSYTQATFENNYTFINGAPAIKSEEAKDWSGLMNQAPIANWDKSIWEIDASNKTLPRLKAFSNVSQTLNPLYGQVAGYHSVIVPKYTGIRMNYSPGTYQVKKGKSFIFTVSPEGSSEIQEITVKTLDGADIPLYAPGNYILRNMDKDAEIAIKGQWIEYDPDGYWPDFADTDWFTKAQNKTTYTISNAEELAGLAKLTNEGHGFRDTTFVLSADIDLRLHKWKPAAEFEKNSFQGILDGSNKQIQNIYIADQHKSTGLFSFLGNGAQIKNVILQSGKISGNKNTGGNEFYPVYTGSLAGAVSANDKTVSIRNCHNVNVTIDGGYDSFRGIDGSDTGGLIGIAFGKISIDSCSNAALVYVSPGEWAGDYRVGGIVGTINGMFTITNGSNTGTIQIGFFRNNAAVGGIVGMATIQKEGASAITSCFNNASLIPSDKTSPSCGGIVGAVSDTYEATAKSQFTLSNCYTNASLLMSGGGLIGQISMTQLSSVKITDNYSVVAFGEPSYYWSSSISGGLIYKVTSTIASFDISNNLAIVMGNYPPSFRLIGDSVETISLSNNYAFANGNPMEDNGQGLNGISWDGKMSDGPFSAWDTKYWSIDNTSKIMPTLKNISGQTEIQNPLYNFSSVYFNVTLPEVKGIRTTYKAGTYKVLKHTDFIFEITPDKDTDISNMKVETGEGITIPLVDNRYYILRKIDKPTQIVIKDVKPKPVGIEEIGTKYKIQAIDQAIYVEISEPARIMVYSISGQIYRQLQLPAGNHFISVPKGIYIVKLADETHKLYVK